jgi:primosomal protein N' (replication factor Y)
VLVEVAVAAAVRGTFTYRVPSRIAGEVTLGRRVAVPFGRSRRATGYVVGFPAAPPAGVRLRDVADVLDAFPLFTPDLVALLRWAEDYYLCPPGELHRAALPPGLNTRRGAEAPSRRGVDWAAPAAGAAASLELLPARARSQRAVLEYLLARGRIPVEELRAAFPRGRPALRELARKGTVRIETEGRVPAGGTLEASGVPLPPTGDQRAALEALAAAAGGFATFLLHGVTGSGKTEVYLQAIAEVRRRDRGALVLVPEIALTPQLAGRFRARFGAEVADEEHDPSFKQEEGPPYQARDLAVVRARLAGTPCVLGSATPSLETLENARRGRYRLLALPRRIDDRPLPRVEIVDLAKLRRTVPSPGLLSPPLADALAETLAARQQAILFLNRRGYQTLVLCQACGREARCPACAVSLTFHRRRGALLCHYCGRAERMTDDCPDCGGPRLGVGVGTEQVEEAVRRLLPAARLARLDRDAVSSAGDVAAVLARFARREVDVLVGTQMVAKGHDFPGVTLVGVVLADTALALPDFRAAERTFQLLAQVAGRAGRGAEGGRVLVQTWNPGSPAVACAAAHDYARFAEAELAARRERGWPPFSRLLAVRIEGPEAGARRAAEALGAAARAALAPGSDLAMLGPAPAALERLRGRSRWHIIFRSADPGALRRAHRALLPAASRPPAGTSVRFDVDPQAML